MRKNPIEHVLSRFKRDGRKTVVTETFYPGAWSPFDDADKPAAKRKRGKGKA